MSEAPRQFPFRNVAVAFLGGTSDYLEGRVRPLIKFLADNARRTVLYVPSGGAEALRREFPTVEFRALYQPFRGVSKFKILANYFCGFVSLLFAPVRDLDCVVGMSGVLNDALGVWYLALRAKAVSATYVDNLVVRDRPGVAWWIALDYFAGMIGERVYRELDALFVNTPVVLKQLIDRGIDGRKIIMGGLGLDEPAYRAAEHDRPARIEGRCTFLGRMNPAKGIFDLLEAWPAILEAVPCATLRMMGGGSEEIMAEFKRRLAQTPGSDRITLLGYVDGPTKYRELLSSKAFLFPTYTEMYSITIREALACGNAVVCYDAPGIRDHYEGDVSLGPLADVKDFTRRAIEALTSPTPPLRHAIEVSYVPYLEREFQELSRFGTPRKAVRSAFRLGRSR